MINVGIVGATGYAGVELIRLLLGHPAVAITRLTSRAEAGVRVDRLFPHLKGFIDLSFEDPAEVDFEDCDLVFFATPHAVAMNSVPALVTRGKRVIDLSADFRLTDTRVWESWYGVNHVAPELVTAAVYGLPEVNREAIRQAQLVACLRVLSNGCAAGLFAVTGGWGLVDAGSLIASVCIGEPVAPAVERQSESTVDRVCGDNEVLWRQWASTFTRDGAGALRA